MSSLPTVKPAHLTPLPRKAGARSKPHRPHKALRWRFPGTGDAPDLLCPGDPFHSELQEQTRRTPSGFTEAELLASLNYLDAEALRSLDGIGPSLAAGIVAVRTENHYFASLDELAQVPRIGARRFARLVGREPRGGRFRLHELMRVPKARDIQLSDLHPWNNPAPGIHSIFLLAAGEAPPAAGPGVCVQLVPVRRHTVAFVCADTPLGGRAQLLLSTLPAVLRSLLT